MCYPVPCQVCGKITWDGCGEHVALLHTVADFDIDTAQMQERTGQAAAVVDQHRATGEYEAGRCEADYPGGRCLHRRAGRHRDIEAIVR